MYRVFEKSRSMEKHHCASRRDLLGGLPSFHSQPPLATGGDNLIPLQHLVQGGVYVGAARSALTNSEVHLGEVTVGTLSQVSSNMLQHFFHIHRNTPPVAKVVRDRSVK
jgi:hypothetical protein